MLIAHTDSSQGLLVLMQYKLVFSNKKFKCLKLMVFLACRGGRLLRCYSQGFSLPSLLKAKEAP